ncbi:MAG: DUF1207 domain-containing protein [Nitrospira sp.]|nr:DUF1207 domain-containing protein [Nitrospira sp.]
MGRKVLFCVRWIVGIVFLSFLLAGQAYADEIGDKNPDGTAPKIPLDCRYGQTYEKTDGETVGEAFPSDDVFRPLLADPKQPQFFANWRSTRSRTDRTTSNVGSVAIGENFGFYTRREGCNGWQISLLTGVFAQFNLDEKNAELINTDFNVGIPITWRSGNWSARLRFYHQSSHIGDEFLAANPGFKSITFILEEVDAILSYDYRWLRLYGGGGYLVHREPTTFDRGKIQWGFEARAPSMRTRILEPFLNRLIVTPVLSADFKSIQAHDWIIDAHVLGGFEWSRTGSFRRFRIMATYFHGYNPYGLFVINQKIESIGAAAYFMF